MTEQNSKIEREGEFEQVGPVRQVGREKTGSPPRGWGVRWLVGRVFQLGEHGMPVSPP